MHPQTAVYFRMHRYSKGQGVAAFGIAMLLTGVIAGHPATAQMERVNTGPLEELRREALSLVNEAREGRDLRSLELTDPLNNAAQTHAEDMLTRDYYSHVSPEGEDVQDRYVDRGGSRWRLVAENIANCSGCAVPPSVSRVREFQQGWMNSPEHRQNILARGLDAFGFGIAARDGRIYAVQTFAGAGTSPGVESVEEPDPLAQDEQLQEAVSAVNRVREEEGLQPLQASDALATVADRLLAAGTADQPIDRSADLMKLLPDDSTGWRELNVVAAVCGGCGTSANAADVEHFTEQWLDDPRYRPSLLSDDATHLGFATNTNGRGRKAAAAVVGG